MRAINYTAKVLPDGHISLPYEIKEAMGLTVNMPTIGGIR